MYMRCLLCVICCKMYGLSIMPARLIRNNARVFQRVSSSNNGQIVVQNDANANVIPLRNIMLPMDVSYAAWYLDACDQKNIFALLDPRFFISLLLHGMNGSSDTGIVLLNNIMHLKIQYINKVQENKTAYIPLLSNAISQNNSWNFVNMLYEQFSPIIKTILNEIDIVMTLKAYNDKMTKNTNALVKNIQYEAIYTNDNKNIEMMSMIVENTHNSMDFGIFEDVLEDERMSIGLRNAESKVMYDQAVNGVLDEKVICMLQRDNVNEQTIFGADARKVMQDFMRVAGQFLNKNIIDKYYEFLTALMQENMPNADDLMHLMHALPVWSILIDNPTFFTNANALRDAVRSKCCKDIEASFVMQLQNTNSINTIVKAILESMNFVTTENIINTFANVIRSYQNYMRNFSQYAKPNMNVFMINKNVLQYNNTHNVKQIAIPFDLDEAIEHTVFANNVSIQQKLTALSLLELIPSNQEDFLVNLLQAKQLQYAYNFMDTNVDSNSNVRYLQLDNKTLLEYVNELCAHEDNYSVWLEALQIQYYELEKQYPKLLEVMFNQQRFVLHDDVPLGMQSILSIRV